MNRTHELREQIDACRAGSDDLSLPELARLREAVERDADVARGLERSQRFDRTVMSAMQDVEIPSGLADRVLASAEAAEVPGDLTLASVTKPPRQRSSRRKWLVEIGSVAALILCGVTTALVVINSQAPRRVTQEELARSAPEWIPQANDLDLKGWKILPGAQPKPPFAVPKRALKVNPVAWRQFVTPMGESGVVYRCTPPGKPAAYLFVLSTPAQYLVGTTPFTRLKGTTGAMAVGAWQTGSTLYVFVVDEDGQRLEDFLRAARLT